MSITHYPPNVIYLGGGTRTQVGDFAASEAITPGMLVERHTSGGVNRWRKHSTAAGPCRAVATDHSMANKGVDDAYAIGSLVEVSELGPGATFWGIVPSGAAIAFGDKLESAGTGKLRAWTASVTPYVALEAVTATADARIRVEVQ